MRAIPLNELSIERKSILFLNGGGQIHITRHQKIARYFENTDYNLISIELPGHGKSSFDHILTEDEFISHLKSEFTKLIKEYDIKIQLMIGFSLGGLVTLKMIEENLFPIPAAIVFGCGFDVDDTRAKTFEYYTSEQFFIDQNWQPIMMKNHGDGWQNLLLSLKDFLYPGCPLFTQPSKLPPETFILLILGENEELFDYTYNSKLSKDYNIDVKLLPSASHFEYTTTKNWDDFKAILDGYKHLF